MRRLLSDENYLQSYITPFKVYGLGLGTMVLGGWMTGMIIHFMKIDSNPSLISRGGEGVVAFLGIILVLGGAYYVKEGVKLDCYYFNRLYNRPIADVENPSVEDEYISSEDETSDDEASLLNSGAVAYSR